MEGQIELEDYLRSLNCEGFDICDYIPKGRANAVTRYELCMKTGFRDRQVRDLIHYARRDGSILNLSDGNGYFSQIAGNLDGIVSQETQLGVLSVVDNVQNEMEKIESEQEKAKTDPVMTQMFGGAGDGKPGVLEEPGNGSKET